MADRVIAQPGEDGLYPMHPDTAARTVGLYAEARRPADLSDPADVQMLYDNAVTLVHLRMIALIQAAKSLGIDTDETFVLTARWGALTAKELNEATIEPATEKVTTPGSPEAMRDALRLIGRGGCESYTRGNCADNGRIRGARYGDEKWCDPCIANTALGLPLGREHH